MTTTITTLSQTLRLAGVTKITVSAIVDDPDNAGGKLRAVRFHTVDPAVPALEIRVAGASADPIKFTAPELPF